MRPERPDLRPERPDLRPERPDLRPERLDLGPEGPDGEDEQTNGRTNESPPVFYRTLSPSEPLPKKKGGGIGVAWLFSMSIFMVIFNVNIGHEPLKGHCSNTKNAAEKQLQKEWRIDATD